MDQQLIDISTKLDKLTTFVQSNMVTKEEMTQLQQELPSRFDFAQLQTSVDGIAKRYIDTQQETTFSIGRTQRMEEWIQRAATKIGVDYKP